MGVSSLVKGSGRDSRGGGGQGGGEGLKNLEVPAGGEPRGDEAVRPHQNPANVAAPRPVGEGRIIAADRRGSRRSSLDR